MRFAGVGVVADTPADAYRVSATAFHSAAPGPDGSVVGALSYRVHDEGGSWWGSAPQAPTVPLGARYLDASDLGEWSLEGRYALSSDGPEVEYAGSATTRFMHLDLADGSIYITLDVHLEPAHAGAGPTIEGRWDAWGFVSQGCPAPGEPAVGFVDGEPDGWAAFCEDYRAAIRATPDDPDAPPPPFDRRDVIECTVGQPCEDQRGSAPWPGPAREHG